MQAVVGSAVAAEQAVGGVGRETSSDAEDNADGGRV